MWLENHGRMYVVDAENIINPDYSISGRFNICFSILILTISNLFR